jgi:hypothetical protein
MPTPRSRAATWRDWEDLEAVGTASAGMIPGCTPIDGKSSVRNPPGALAYRVAAIMFLFQHAEKCFSFNAGTRNSPVIVSVSEGPECTTFQLPGAASCLARPIY